MIFSNNLGIDGRGWRRVLVIGAICSLTVCVATRFSLSLSAPGRMVKSMDLRSGSSKQQHLDQDDTRFVEPVAAGVSLEHVVHYSSVTPAEPLRSSADFVLVLLNRPPPHFSVFFC